jgi:hypothetical protein
MLKTNCMHYRVDKKILQNKELRVSRSPKELQNVSNEWCEHEDSPHRQFEKGELICKGDIKKCPIGFTEK